MPNNLELKEIKRFERCIEFENKKLIDKLVKEIALMDMQVAGRYKMYFARRKYEKQLRT
jgi:hypothetical protein